MNTIEIQRLKSEVNMSMSELVRISEYLASEFSYKTLDQVRDVTKSEKISKIQREIRALHYKLLIETLAANGVSIKLEGVK